MPKTKYIERDAKLFVAGNFPDKGIEITEDDLGVIEKNFSEAPVKIEHQDTALDGALGTLKSVVRKGTELMGRISFTQEAWSLLDKAGARKLSVAIKKDKTNITEVSIVKNPRVAGAAVFDDRIEFEGVVEFGFGGLSASDIDSRIREYLKPVRVLGPDGYYTTQGDWPYTRGIYEDYAIVEMGRKSYKYPFTVKDGVLTLGTPVEVVQDWKPVKAAKTTTTMSEDERGASEVPEKTDVVQMNKADLDALLAQTRADAETKAKQEATAEFSTELQKRDQRMASLETTLLSERVDKQIAEFKRSGKLTPAAEPFAKVILMSGDNTTVKDVCFSDDGKTEAEGSISVAFAKLLAAQPAVIKFGETGAADDPNKEVTFSDSQIEVTMKVNGCDRDKAIELLKKHGDK